MMSMRSGRSTFSFLVMGAGIASGCMPSSSEQDTGGEAAAALTSTNGLNMINGLSATNGLNMINGLNMM